MEIDDDGRKYDTVFVSLNVHSSQDFPWILCDLTHNISIIDNESGFQPLLLDNLYLKHLHTSK